MSRAETSLAAHRALAEASRVQILLELRSGPLDAPMLAERTGLHVNTVRSHLEILAGAGMIAGAPERREGRGRGRPRVLYRLLPGAIAGPDDGYRMLARVLAETLRAGGRPAEAAEGVGESWGRRLAGGRSPAVSAEDAVGRVVQLFGELGFAPEAAEEGGRRRILLHRCPFREAVESNQEVVCSVHLGLLRGALREMGAPLGVADLQPLVEPDLCIAHLAPR